MLNLRHLRAFIAVAEIGGVSRAAEFLLRAQSVVTRSVHELESALGVPLFERRPGGMRPTPYGAALLLRARRAAAELAQALGDMQALCGRGLPSARAPVFTMQVSNRRLQAFVLLAELHHMPEVARRLGITQPAVSAAVRELEESLRSALFTRTPHGLLPTPAARALALRAKLALAEVRHAVEEIESLQGKKAGHARIGALALSRAAIIVPRAIARVVARHPDLRVTVVEGAFATQEDALRSGELDFIFGALRDFPRATDLEGEALLVDQLALAVRGGHPLCRRRNPAWRELHAYPWVLNRAGTPGRERLESAFRARGLDMPRVVIDTGSLAMTRALLLESDCITALSPHQFEHELRAGLIASLPYDLPETARWLGFIRRRGSVLPPSAELVVEALREVVHEGET
jgi:LysR family transcriptional regulator of gallate degradation